MYAKQVNDQSPLRILDDSIHGGLGKGNLGVVMARAGVGKTACLVQIGLDDLMRDRPVLHVALGQTMDHVLSWYDALFDDLAARTALDDREEVREHIGRLRVIAAFADHDLTQARLEKAVALFRQASSLTPSAILVDGYPWNGSVASTAAMLGALKAYAKMLGAELWLSAQTHRSATGKHPTTLTPPCEPFGELIDVAIFLEPHDQHVAVRLLKDHGDAIPPDTHLTLHCDTMRLVADDQDCVPTRLPVNAFTLLSGGAQGAEAEFGACAERWGIGEINFSFEGRNPARARHVVLLGETELRQGEVSSAYLVAHMHRVYPDTMIFRKTLQSIWHQVNSAGEVFVVGIILDDKTIKGGTGWAAELGRHWGKPVHVFDQERHGWFSWHDGDWRAEAPPTVTRSRFTGTGTRFLTDEGKAAIHALFERSFGAPAR